MDPLAPESADEVFLTAEEYEAVHAAVRTVAGARGSGQPRTLNALLEQWNELVHEVEEGYGWSAPELSNDLWCRTALAQIWTLLPPRVRAIRQPELDEIDRRFHASTVGWPGRDDQEGQWWMRRVPRHLETETSQRSTHGWPMGWDVMAFPKPEAVEIAD
ncbi:hypothetical protein ACFQ7O_32495 [Streptomyces sp. NPDC056485]|uniref:hypothetical protein n=1 Tax=Streptomyces sp. NPDC056485 TaxID=3345834 RepID=UPI0036785557